MDKGIIINIELNAAFLMCKYISLMPYTVMPGNRGTWLPKKGVLYLQRRNQISPTLVLGGENNFLDYVARKNIPILLTFYFIGIFFLPYRRCSQLQ